MANKFCLPPGITRAAIEEASGGKDSAWRRALLFALSREHSARRIAGLAGIGYATLFRKKKLLFCEGGLQRSFQKRHGGGPQSVIDERAEKNLRCWFSQALTGTVIQSRLKGMGIHVSLSTVQLWKAKLGFVRKRPKRSGKRKSNRRVKDDPLYCPMDSDTLTHVRALNLCREGWVGGAPTRAARRTIIMELLGWRTVGNDAGNTMSGREIAGKLNCSPKLLYHLADLFRVARYHWDTFCDMAFSPTTLQNFRFRMRDY
jgi:hypothetical protein